MNYNLCIGSDTVSIRIHLEPFLGDFRNKIWCLWLDEDYTKKIVLDADRIAIEIL